QPFEDRVPPQQEAAVGVLLLRRRLRPLRGRAGEGRCGRAAEVLHAGEVAGELSRGHLSGEGGAFLPLTRPDLIYFVVHMADQALGEFEQIVLLAILRLDERAYGVTIREEIAAKTGRDPSPGALYTTLARLEEKGLLQSRLGEPTRDRGGRAKRFVKVTGAGVDAISRAQRAYRNL